MAKRIFMIGAVILFAGFQLREVDSFVLNETVTKVINDQMAKTGDVASKPKEASVFDPHYIDAPEVKKAAMPSKRSIKPPRWLAYSFLSIGAVLMSACPLFRSE